MGGMLATEKSPTHQSKKYCPQGPREVPFRLLVRCSDIFKLEGLHVPNES